MPYQVNEVLLDAAVEALAQRDDIYWIIGGACTGKSAVCRCVAGLTGISLFDMDAHIYGGWMPRYTTQRHPASTDWFGAEDSLGWILALPLSTFDALNRAANAEYLDLFSEDAMESPGPLLVDGGITHPSVLTRVIPDDRIICLTVDPAEAEASWTHDENRSEMKSAVEGVTTVPDPWGRFLQMDRLISGTMVRESLAEGITVIDRDDRPVDKIARLVMANLGLG